MWIFNKDGYFSAVEHRDKPDHLMVRARRKEDIERLAEKLQAKAAFTPDADYAFRVTVSKSACASHGARSRAYMDVWTVMHRFQEEED